MDQFIGPKRMEYGDFVYTVEELRPEVLAEFIKCLCLQLLISMAFLVSYFRHALFGPVCTVRNVQEFCKVTCKDVRGHDEECVLEIHCPALGIRQPAVIQYLQHDVEHIRMCLLYLIKEHHCIRSPSHGFGELSTFIMADVTRRCTYHTGNCVLLHILGHVDAYYVVLVIEEFSRKGFGKFCLTYAGRSQEYEASNGSLWIFDTCISTDHRISYCLYSFFLAYDALVQVLFDMHKFLTLSFQKLGDRDLRPDRNDICNILFTHFFAQQHLILRSLERFLFLSILVLQGDKGSIFQL